MFDSYYPDTEDLIRRQKLRQTLLMAGLIAAVTIAFGIIGALTYFTRVPGPAAWIAGVVAFCCLSLPFVIWHNPRLGLYFLFASVLLPDTIPWLIHDAPPLGLLPLWENISTIGQSFYTSALNPIVFSPGELILVMTVLAWVVRDIVLRRFKLERGAFFGPIVAYLTMVAIGWVWGISSGGNKTEALREVRAQFHLFAAYLLAANLIREPRHVRPLLWMSTLLIGLTGIIGSMSYFVLHDQVTEQGIPGLTHSTSLTFNTLLFLCLIGLITRFDRRLAWTAGLLSVPVLIADLGNQRRAGIASFIIAFVPLLPLLWVLFEERRKQILRFGFVFAVLAAVYVPAGWNSDATWALGARAIRSSTDPNARDASSDYYRLAEDLDLKATRDSSPWIGFGYGKYFLQPVPLPHVSTDLLFITPHNGVLWVWMRLGHIGFFLFLMMYAAILIKGPQILKTVRDPSLKVVGVLAILQMVMLFIYGKYDLQLTMPRQMIFSGMLIGVLGAARALDAKLSSEDLPAEAAEAHDVAV